MGFKVNFAPPPKILARTLARFPAQLLGTGGVTISQSGGVVTIDGSGLSTVISLVDGPTVSLDAELGGVFELIAGGDRTLLAPSNAPGVGYTQKMIIRHRASGANRTLTLTTGSAGSFRFGTTITALTVTTSGLTDYIGCLWNQPASRWDVVAYAKGF